MDESSEFLSAKEFASLIRVHYNTVVRAIKKGRINAFRVGEGKKSSYRIPRSEIQRIALMDMEKLINQLIDLKIKL